MSNQLNGKKKQCRFSAHTVNISLSLYLRSKQVYDNLRDSSLLILSHPNILNNITTKLKIKAGGDPSVYLPLKDEINCEKEQIRGHPMMDEFKLKNGMAYNCNSNEIARFVADQLNTKQILENILNITTQKKLGAQVSIYANQWRFLSTRGIVHNGNFLL